jgi:hypothetical protein
MNDKYFRAPVIATPWAIGILIPVDQARSDSFDLEAMTARWWRWVYSIAPLPSALFRHRTKDRSLAMGR